MKNKWKENIVQDMKRINVHSLMVLCWIELAWWREIKGNLRKERI